MSAHYPRCGECGDLWPCRAGIEQMNRSAVLADIGLHRSVQFEMRVGEPTCIVARNGATLPADDPQVIALLEEIGYRVERDGRGRVVGFAFGSPS